MDELRPSNRQKEADPNSILERAYEAAVASVGTSLVANRDIQARIELVSQGKGNKSCVRALLACALAKAHNPRIDIRKPYTKISASDVYSGRDYDESYVGPFVARHRLPCNETTAFLTPAFRNRNIVLTAKVDLVGRPPHIYVAFLRLINDIHQQRVSAETILAETLRQLAVIRDENNVKIKGLLSNLRRETSGNVLASEAIVKLVEHHLSMGGASRLPVLIVAAAYKVAEKNLGERMLPLEAHNAADQQTGALGDIQIAVEDDDHVTTVYEMKKRPVTIGDIDLVLTKINEQVSINNYIFVTTETVEQNVKDYAAKMYARTGGVEIAVLDCIGFLRHFLHLFHRLRGTFLNTYQELVLSEPESAIGQHLKEALLLLRTAAEKANIVE